MKAATICLVFLLAGCGAAYISPGVSERNTDVAVRIVPLTGETVLQANRSSYNPKQLPSIFFQNDGQGPRPGDVPRDVFNEPKRPGSLELKIPPTLPSRPYTIGVGDVVILATRSAGTTVEELTGLLAAQNQRQGYTVQDDGAIAVPELGRVSIAEMTLEQAEAVVFQRLVEKQIDPTFSLEIAEFNSKRVSIGGAVKIPSVVPIRLSPLYLEEALTAAGGVTAPDQDYVAIRIYRDGEMYQIPLNDLYSRRSLQKIPLVSGDSIFVDTSYDLTEAQAFFNQELSLVTAEANLRREERENFKSQVEFDAVDFDYVYLTGEFLAPGRMRLPLGRKATLADAIYTERGGIPTDKANVAQIYVLRASPDPQAFGAVTAWHLNARNVVNAILATRLELRPNDIIFVAEQPVTKWGRVVNQISPTLIATGSNIAAR